MSVLNLMAKLGLDISGFQQGIAKAKVAVAPVTDYIGNNIRGQIKSALGAVAATAVVKKSLETASEIHRGANRMGISTDTYQTLKIASDRYGMSVEELAKEMKSGSIIGSELKAIVADLNTEYNRTGQIINEDTVKNLHAANEQLEVMMNKLSPIAAWAVDKGIRGVDATHGIDRMTKPWLYNMMEGKPAFSGWFDQIKKGLSEFKSAFAPASERNAELAPKSRMESAINFMQRFTYGRDRTPAISSLGSVGGYMNPGMQIFAKGPEYQLQQLNSQVAEIRHNTRRFAE